MALQARRAYIEMRAHVCWSQRRFDLPVKKYSSLVSAHRGTVESRLNDDFMLLNRTVEASSVDDATV